MSEPIQTKDYWDGAVDAYVAQAEPFTSQFCEDAALLADIAPGMTMLDVATGPGAAALAAARAGAIVTATDFSPGMIERLGTRIGNLPITAVCMDGQALDLPDGHFDRACCVLGLPLFPNWRAGLRELARVLRPGGRAVVTVADNPHGFGPNQLLARSRATLCPHAPPPLDALRMDLIASHDELIAEFEAAGFSDVQIEECSHDFVLDAALFVADHPMIIANPILAGLAEDERSRVIKDAIIQAQRRGKGDKLLLASTARFIIGTKA